MFTHKDVLIGICSHREYMAQFVSEKVKQIVLERFSKDELLNSTDKWLNDIPLKRWDALHPLFKRINKEDNSLSFSVCLGKEAAFQLIEEWKKEKNINIITNNKPRKLLEFSELPEKVLKKEFYWVEPSNFNFFKFKDRYYCIEEFTIPPKDISSRGWHGILTDSFFSGILIRYLNDEEIVVGTCFY